MIRNLFVVLLLIILVPGCNPFKRTEPTLLTMEFDHLLEIRDAITKYSPIYEVAFKKLCKDAEKALNNIESVKSKREGYTVDQMTDDVMSLTLAWFYTGEEKYAIKAANLIHSWFIQSGSAENSSLPDIQESSLNFGNGECKIIDTRRYIEILDAVKILETSPEWDNRLTKKLQVWFSDYLRWLLNSDRGKAEGAKENSEGSWYDLQLACYADFVGNNQQVRDIILNSGSNRINNQIDSFGRQNFELVKVSSFSCSVFNLEALILLGKLGEITGIGFWREDPYPAFKIKSACDYLFSYINRMDEWPYQQVMPVDCTALIPIAKEAYKFFKDPEYIIYLEHLKGKLKSNDRLIITKI